MFLSILINFLLTITIIVSILMILVVLMQRPKSEGLGAAFGGGMTENLFGAQTSNVLTRITRWLGGIFFFLTLALSVLYAKTSVAKSEIQKELIGQTQAVPAAPAKPAASAVPAESKK
jgi:preprotein translocase subunit SecG